MKTLHDVFSETNWEVHPSYPEGTKVKVLRDEDGAKTLLLKLPAGFHMEGHSHISTEQHFVLEGSYVSDGVEYREGTYQIIHAGVQHGPFTSENGAVILVIWDPLPTAEK